MFTDEQLSKLSLEETEKLLRDMPKPAIPSLDDLKEMNVGIYDKNGIYDYPIKNYQDTGLTKQPSIVRCNCVFTISNTENLQKIRKSFPI